MRMYIAVAHGFISAVCWIEVLLFRKISLVLLFGVFAASAFCAQRGRLLAQSGPRNLAKILPYLVNDAEQIRIYEAMVERREKRFALFHFNLLCLNFILLIATTAILPSSN